MSEDAVKYAGHAPKIVEGATTGDLDDEVAPAANSAEDRKAAAALSSLDAPRDEEAGKQDVDQEAVRRAMDRLSFTGTQAKRPESKKEEVKKIVKVDVADVAQVVSRSRAVI
jgi:hypothetical protein